MGLVFTVWRRFVPRCLLAHWSRYNTFFIDLPGPSFVSHSSSLTTKVDFVVGPWWLKWIIHNFHRFSNSKLIFTPQYCWACGKSPTSPILASHNDNYFRSDYCLSVQDYIVSNDFAVNGSESECLVIKCYVITHWF